MTRVLRAVSMTAALSGRPETETFRETSREFYVERLRSAFRPYAPAHGEDPAILVGILGALESLAHEAVTGRAGAAEAAEAAVAVIVGALDGAPTPTPADDGDPRNTTR
jgi:hypothetical protein